MPRKAVDSVCLFCQVSFEYRPGRSYGKYCSNQCQFDYQWAQRVLDIKRTGVFKRGIDAKRYLLEKHGHRCSICRKRTWMKQPIPLVLDHIDGNSDNWKVKNCRHICANCDRQQPTYGSRNRGNGRLARLDKLHSKKLAIAQKKVKAARLIAKAKRLMK